MRIFYSILIYLLRPAVLAGVLWRGFSDRRYWEALSERFGCGAGCAAPTLWVHAVSLGEVSAAAALILALRDRHPQTPLVLTTATPTGRAQARALFGDAVTVRFLPYDTPGSMRRFLARVRPRVAIVMETELWPNLFHACRQRGVPVMLASARLSVKSVARYGRFPGLFREALSSCALVAAQSAEDVERFIALGADPGRTRSVGNLKFDWVPDPTLPARGRMLRTACWNARSVWIAGSTHEGEDAPVLAAHRELTAAFPDALLLLVPRHPQRFAAVAELLARRGFRFERRSSGRAPGPEVQVLLVDTVGELAMLYASVDLAFVGGSLVPAGGHNLLEPAALGVPVITGPHQANGRDIARLLLQQGAAFQVADAEELAMMLQRLFADPGLRVQAGANGRHAVEVNRGSLARLLGFIEPLLAQRGEPPGTQAPARQPRGPAR